MSDFDTPASTIAHEGSRPVSRDLDRRGFLKMTGVGLAASVLPAVAAGQSAPPAAVTRDKRPNILFIWTDQLTRTAMSHAGNIHVRTPAIDSIARGGVVFDRAYTANPICVPSRTCWITGQMSHRTTVSFNTPKHTIATPAVSSLMREAGYDTGYVGKWHIPHPVADAAWHGFDYVRHALPNKVDPDVPGSCIEFIQQPRSKPFFLVASFVDPHDICEWARIESGMKDEFKNGPVPFPPPADQCPPSPANFEIPADEPEVIRQLQLLSPPTYPTRGWPEDKWRQYLWVYYRLIELVDRRIGEILAALKASGQDENTVILFASDHGDGSGSHRWNQKTVFYEQVVGVPVIVRPPACERAGTRDGSSLVSMNLDFFPTVFDYAGIKTPAELPGKSLRPLVEGRSDAAGHDLIVSQNDLAPISGQSGKIYGRMLVTGRYKYIRYSAGEQREQFFDLALDPGEMNSLVSVAARHHEVQHHRDLLDQWLKREGDPFPNPICAEDLTMVARKGGAD